MGGNESPHDQLVDLERKSVRLKDESENKEDRKEERKKETKEEKGNGNKRRGKKKTHLSNGHL